MWNKYQSEAVPQTQNQYLDYLIEMGFETVNRLFVFTLGNNTFRTGHT